MGKNLALSIAFEEKVSDCYLPTWLTQFDPDTDLGQFFYRN